MATLIKSLNAVGIVYFTVLLTLSAVNKLEVQHASFSFNF